jgi:hypothetical protein
MAIVVLNVFVFMVLVAVVWAISTQESGAAGVAAPSADSRAQADRPRAAPERCRSARGAVPFYRAGTWDWQQKRYGQLADRTPLVRGKSCHWARYAAEEWTARAASARRSYDRWWKSVGQTVRRLDAGLAGTPMAGTGASLEKHGRRHGVSPYFMAAVAATESSLGAAACGAGGYNAWGLGNCGTAWSVPSFSSWDEAIAYYARFLTRWSGHATPYSFRGYAACDECWARKVSEWMGRLFGVSSETRYP